jgi:hypothetical protein
MGNKQQYRMTSIRHSDDTWEKAEDIWHDIETNDGSFGVEDRGTTYCIQIRDAPKFEWGQRVVHSEYGNGVYLGKTVAAWEGRDAKVIFPGNNSHITVYEEDLEALDD